MSIRKIPHNDLITIFNNILNSYSIDIGIINKVFGEIEPKTYREDKSFEKYLDEKQTDIEFKLDVFENIPLIHIYDVMQDFIKILIDYNRSVVYKKNNAEQLQKESYNLRQKDIKIIKAYQEMIFDYTSDNDWNDGDLSILNPILDDIYQTNKQLLQELETKDYQILDVFRYGGTKLFDSTKKSIKKFFHSLQKEYTLSTFKTKEMVDTL